MTADAFVSSNNGATKKTQWEPPLINSINERGPLPKHLTLPYLDEMRLVADAKKIAVKEISKLARELKFYKFIGTGLSILSGFMFILAYLSLAIAHKTVLVDPLLFKLMIPAISVSLLIRYGCIFIEKKYVEKPTLSPVVFDRFNHTLSITHGWKRKKIVSSFDYVHAYIRYLSTPSGLSQPKLMIKLFDEQAPYKVKLNYFLNLGPADTEYEIAAQWCVICQFMDQSKEYPYNPQFWNAAIEHHYPEEFRKYITEGTDGHAPEEAADYYGERLMDYAIDQNAMGIIGAEKAAGLYGLFDPENPYKRSYTDLVNRQEDIKNQLAELEKQFGIPFPIPPSGIWERRR